MQILDATPREILDFAPALNRVRELHEPTSYKSANVNCDETSVALLNQIRELAKLSLDEQSFLKEKHRAVLEGIFPTRYYDPENIIFDLNRLELKADHGKKKKYSNLYYRKHNSWSLSINADFLEEKSSTFSTDPFGKLPPRQAAWFILLHDLACYSNEDYVKGNLIEKYCSDYNMRPKTKQYTPILALLQHKKRRQPFPSSRI